ncbi:MAG: MarR family transcriptional regulator [Steroidobacteraceae bacterium]
MAKQQQPFRIGFLVHDVSRLRRTIFDKTLKPLGVTRSQWWVLANLSRHPSEGMMQTELAQVLDVGKVTLGGLIDRLEASAYVERQPVPNDRRAKRVVLTAKGGKLLAQCQRLAEVVNREIMDGIDPKEILRAEAVLHQMKRQLISMDAVPSYLNYNGRKLQSRPAKRLTVQSV